ncbi:MAG: Crp/Fnr family transcriptional regulator [Saprospiraceae bacterium]|nr:Crp/Fnr family transcriptional regulator [Saprospiraceae bacterium]MCB0623821.1 Crp/Fnr family transcriptional regulator [Saprospiraceae bacterium]MCB0677228.1 Crp/Fnr family transcriptional regulator [Saprospiraceae bacterium]
MKDQALWFLENIDVTGIFCPKKLGSGAFHVDKRYRKGEYVYMPDDAADKIFFLFDGRIKIGAYGDSGKEITKAILGRGEVFGELAVLGEKTRRDFAQAMEDTTVCMISANEMKTLMQDHSTLSLFLMKMMGSRMLEMENRLEALVFKDSRTRIIEFIRDLAQKKGQRVGYETLVRKFLTHQEIANLTATSRQTVTTVLNDLRNKNILTFNRRRLLVRDMKLLEQEAGQVA